MAQISKDTPISEITLRKYESPSNLGLYELCRRVMLSLGLLQPGDSRDVIVDVFQAIVENKALLPEEVEKKVTELRTKRQTSIKGITPPNIRRQLLRLKNIFLIDKVDGKYVVKENENFEKLWKDHIEGYLLNTIKSRVKEYLQALDKSKP